MNYDLDKAHAIAYGFDRGNVEDALDSIKITCQYLLKEDIQVRHLRRFVNGDQVHELEIMFCTETHEHKVTYPLGRDWKGTMHQALKRYRPSLIPYLTNSCKAIRLCDPEIDQI